jgi:8-oxo-dGTP diphosphatase
LDYHIRVNARGIVLNNEHILLNEFGDGEYYNIPGGGIEVGEVAEETVKREIKEETGLSVNIGDLICVVEYEPNHCDLRYGKIPQLSLIFRCYLDGSDEICEPIVPDFNPDNNEMIGRPKWIPINRLRGLTCIPNIHEELLEYIMTSGNDIGMRYKELTVD